MPGVLEVCCRAAKLCATYRSHRRSGCLPSPFMYSLCRCAGITYRAYEQSSSDTDAKLVLRLAVRCMAYAWAAYLAGT